MNIGVETEKIEFKKTTGELREGVISLASMLNKNGSDKPYSAYGRYYMRSADEDRELSPSALKELMERQGGRKKGIWICK